MKKQIVLDGITFDYYIYSDGRCQNIITNNFLKGSIVNGYRNYYIRKGKIQKNIGAHRLVALMFLENNNNYPIVHHIDGNKLNNNIENLQWVSSSQNAKEIKDNSHKKNKRPKYEYYTGDLEGEIWETYRDTHLKFSNYGRLLNTLTNRILKEHQDKNGYCYYSPKLDGKTKKILAHRGVYESFNKIILTREQQIDHIDSDRSNNSLDNLRLVNTQENCQYRSDKIVALYDYVIGQYDLDNNLIAIFPSQSAAAKSIGVSTGSISGAVNGKCKTIKNFIWKKISKQEVQRLSVMNVAE